MEQIKTLDELFLEEEERMIEAYRNSPEFLQECAEAFADLDAQFYGETK